MAVGGGGVTDGGVTGGGVTGGGVTGGGVTGGGVITGGVVGGGDGADGTVGGGADIALPLPPPQPARHRHAEAASVTTRSTGRAPVSPAIALNIPYLHIVLPRTHNSHCCDDKKPSEGRRPTLQAIASDARKCLAHNIWLSAES